MNQGGHWAEISPLRLCGSPDSMFGISLAVLGDLNQDGFPGVTRAQEWEGQGQGLGGASEVKGRASLSSLLLLLTILQMSPIPPFPPKGRSFEGSGREATWAQT